MMLTSESIASNPGPVLLCTISWQVVPHTGTPHLEPSHHEVVAESFIVSHREWKAHFQNDSESDMIDNKVQT